MEDTHPPFDDAIHIDAEQSWSMAPEEPTGGPDRPFDILFVHGMASGGWIWKPGFLARFRADGYRVWTLTLPGRVGGPTVRTDPEALPRATRAAMEADNPKDALSILASVLPGANMLDGPSMDDFSNTLNDALHAIGRPVVAVGHSLGGAILQNLVRRQGAPHGVALVCATPPYGTWRASVQMAMTNLPLWKALFDYSLFGLAHTDHGVMRQNLFPNGVSEHDYLTFIRHLRDESLAATLTASGLPPFAPLPGRRDNFMVIGSARDRLVPPADVWLTGAWYGQSPTILPDAGHMPMLEPGRDALADALLDWMNRL